MQFAHVADNDIAEPQKKLAPVLVHDEVVGIAVELLVAQLRRVAALGYFGTCHAHHH